MAKKTEHYTGAEISLICREAVMLALEDNIDCENIGVEHL
jgi:SpoVK/Ycf46/Vps4 family AAA+-type ATPase